MVYGLSVCFSDSSMLLPLYPGQGTTDNEWLSAPQQPQQGGEQRHCGHAENYASGPRVR